MAILRKTKKVLIIDDSAFMRRVISDIISNDERLEVIGTAINGKDGLKMVNELGPDVITLDIQMPVMNGLEMLKILQKNHSIPVIMLSTLVKEGAKETIEALELGAFDFVTKPENIYKINSSEIKDNLIQKIILACESKHGNLGVYKPFSPSLRTTVQVESTKRVKKPQDVKNLVAIGTSTGGPRALQSVIPFLPSVLNSGVVVVQHMPPGFTKSLSDRLNQLSSIYVKEAEDGDVITNGTVFIAPGDRHLEVVQKSNALVIRLSDEPAYGGHKPAVDVMMNSIAKIKGIKLTGVIMTGMGSDGTKGVTEVRSKNAMHIIVQDEESCVVYGMPKSVVEKGLANEIVTLATIADAIIKQSGVL
ncbi:MAG: chemotaxis response regulator protein-glutamate methylesterase [Vallitaleaceae bacterium]|jgi:two-component system chemotaxis response regulator CheB|nr:chemotaxis response regulator protein-glutamate methylesterase [Vallitaleaceae bacterium]